MDKLLKIVEKLPEEHVIMMLHHSGVDVERALAALDDSVQKKQDDWEKIKSAPRKHSDIAKGKPKEVPVGSAKPVRSKLPVYLEMQGDGMGIGDY